MTYWYVAIIVIVLSQEEALTVTFPFRDEMSCGAALPLLAEAARIDHPESYATCQKTDLPSSSLRPQARP